ncbi:MAG: hypothetical protein KJ000_29005 [Pirellulaceae bacterium]|nr:hypothetical protein [Pirellulaceae bacterium]
MKAAFLSILAALAMLAAANSASASEIIEITIQVAPNVVSLDSQGEVLTVHTDIAYGLVDGWSVALNDQPIQSWKSDNQGNFVAKFNLDTVKSWIPIGTVTVTMTGVTKDGVEFAGSDTIKVIKPKK